MSKCEVVDYPFGTWAYFDGKNYFNDKSNNLKWIHLGNAGIDNSLFEEVIKSNVIITNSRGINSVPVSEFVLSAILFLCSERSFTFGL